MSPPALLLKDRPPVNKELRSKHGRRRHKRIIFRREVMLVDYSGLDICRAMILDISDGGARLQVPLKMSRLIPRKFTMWLSQNGAAQRPCELVWRKYSILGVRFEKLDDPFLLQDLPDQMD